MLKTVYAVRRDISRGVVSIVRLWITRSTAEADAEKLARELASRGKTRSVEQDEYDPKRWNVLEPGWPTEPRQIASYYVVEMEVHGSAVDFLAAVVA